MRLAVTCNGPGETAGWLRPFLRELYARDPRSDVHVFYVPDDYATGREAQCGSRMVFRGARLRSENVPAHRFRRARRRSPASRGRGAVSGRGLDARGSPAQALRRCAGNVQIFAAALRCRQRHCAFAVDEANAAQLAAWGVARDRIDRVGNLAIDGALRRSALAAGKRSARGRRTLHARIAPLRSRASHAVFLYGRTDDAARGSLAADRVRHLAVHRDSSRSRRGRTRRRSAYVRAARHRPRTQLEAPF